MKYEKVELDLEIYTNFYNEIGGGIDGYYEKTIINGSCYKVVDEEVIAYFTIYPERGLTSLVVLDEFKERYTEVFEYVLSTKLFDKILFSENDTLLNDEVKNKGYLKEVQSYNFDVSEEVESELSMMPTTPDEVEMIIEQFGEFINYNGMNLYEIPTFYYYDEELIAFGGLEQLKLNQDRFCLSMIVNEKYRGQGIGSEVVKYLIEFLQLNGLQANARCYVLNEASRHTLLKSGMYISNKLFKVENIG